MIKTEIINLQEVDSTNTYLQKQLLNKSLPEGIVIVADSQTFGRGYGENHWKSEPGMNLTFSLLLRPRFLKPSSQFVINQLVSLAIVRILSGYAGGEKFYIKWPNDIYAGSKKIGGILIWNSIKGASFDYSIIGIGLNVNQQTFSESLPNPVSIRQLTGKKTDLNKLLEMLLKEIVTLYEYSASSSFLEDLQRWYLESMYRRGEWRNFQKGDLIFRGRIKGTGDHGELLIEDEAGRVDKYGFKEVEYLQ